MIKLVLDIETLPCEESKREEFVQILKKRKSNEGLTDDQLYHNTGLDGTLGRICCIGYMKQSATNDITEGVLSIGEYDEKELLKRFWEIAQDVTLFIGHNIMDFDLPFILKRSIILGVKPSKAISFARYRSEPIYDTQKEWDKWAFGQAHKLDTLAKALDLPTSKDKMDGSEVWEYYQAGKLKEIEEYCLKDVELTKQVYRKMNFI